MWDGKSELTHVVTKDPSVPSTTLIGQNCIMAKQDQVSWWKESVMRSFKHGCLVPGKRFDALCAVWRAVGHLDSVAKIEFGDSKDDPDTYFSKLDSVTIWAPPLNMLGMAYINKMSGSSVYLCPMLEFAKPAAVRHTVAHELAHVYLGHHSGLGIRANANADDKPHDEQQNEIDADALALLWGFKRPKSVLWFRDQVNIHLSRSSKTEQKRFLKMLSCESV